MPRIAPSRAPAWNHGILTRHAVVLRLFLQLDADDRWQVLPGGLVRSAPDPTFAHVGLRQGGTSKDCWVPTEASQDGVVPPQLPGMRSVTWRSDLDLPSSVLDDLFWFGRTCEGLDHLARLLRVSVAVERGRLLGERDGAAALFERLIDRHLGPTTDSQPGRRLTDLVLAGPPALSLHHHLAELLRLARNTRGWLSGDTWLLVGELRQQLLGVGINRDAPLVSLDRLAVRTLLGADALVGTLSDNMVRDHTWTFVALGRHLQRGLLLAELLAAITELDPPPADLLLALEVADSAVIWRSRFGRQIDPVACTDLLADLVENPRSLAFQIGRCRQRLGSLPGMPGIDEPLPGRLDAIAAAADARRFDQVASGFVELAEAIDHRWFSHALTGRSIDRSQVTS